MKIILDTSSHIFRTFFTLSLFLFAIVLLGSSAYSAWSNPTATPPSNNVDAPVNVGATSQIKSGPLQVNGFHNTGYSVFGNGVTIGGSSGNTGWRLSAVGNSYGIYAESTTGQAIRGLTTTGYAGYFAVATGDTGGGAYAANGQGTYAYLAYPNSTTWGVYTNKSTYAAGQVRGDGGFCIGGSCITSWSQAGGGVSAVTTVSCTAEYPGCTATCPSGYYRTGCDGFLSSNSGKLSVYPSGSNACNGDSGQWGVSATIHAYCAR